MSLNFEGKNIAVTGASEGIGLGIARALVNSGATVFMTGRREIELQAAAKKIGPRAIPVRADSAVRQDLLALYQYIANEVGHLDAVVANAGIVGGEALGQISEKSYDDLFGVNVKGTLFTVQEALPLLRDGASIVLLSSTMAFKGNPATSLYAATKAAIRSFARNWALDLADRRIRVNVVSPGVIHTEGFDRLFEDPAMRTQVIDKLSRLSPSKRLGTIEDVAAAVCFLISDEAGYFNGADLQIDGGAAQI